MDQADAGRTSEARGLHEPDRGARRHARLTIERTHGNWHDPTLETVLERTLT